eukprot:10923273-Alexandrium_andersonii.AAC.1
MSTRTFGTLSKSAIQATAGSEAWRNRAVEMRLQRQSEQQLQPRAEHRPTSGRNGRKKGEADRTASQSWECLLCGEKI